mmetsp:Transcript_62604/g.158498  ORF Transcript_62604/g.158498 Transcript_62604/m.158498 type:complete len:225 (-) Transcript_62604:441-1115(-)
MERLIVDRRTRDAGEVQAELLNQGPLVVHSPLSIVLPLARCRVALHQRFDEARPPGETPSRRTVRGRTQVCPCENIGHRALVAIVVVAFAYTVRDVDLDVWESPHLAEHGIPQGLLADDPTAPRARIKVLLMEILVDCGIDVTAEVPHLVGALDHEATRVKGLRPVRDHQVLDQARIVERLGCHVCGRDHRGRQDSSIRCLRLSGGRQDIRRDLRRPEANEHPS